MVEDTVTRGTMGDLNNSEIEGTAAPQVLDAACMAELRGLDPDGKAQLVKRVLATYQASLAKLVGQLREARADGTWDQVSRVAHTLKSSSASIGALALSTLCAEIERLLRAGRQRRRRRAARSLPRRGRPRRDRRRPGAAAPGGRRVMSTLPARGVPAGVCS